MIEKEISSGTDAARLSLRSNIVFIRLPRIVADVRWLRYESSSCNTDHIAEIFQRIVTYAHEMCQARETASESRMLHNVKLTQTVDQTSQQVVPFSFVFTKDEDPNAVWMYWSARLASINIVLKVAELLPRVFEVSAADLLAAKERLAMNLLMSWEYANVVGPFATLWVSKSFIHFWSALRKNKTFRGKPTLPVREWVLARVNHPFSEWLSEAVDEKAIDFAARCSMVVHLAGLLLLQGSKENSR